MVNSITPSRAKLIQTWHGTFNAELANFSYNWIKEIAFYPSTGSIISDSLSNNFGCTMVIKGMHIILSSHKFK